MNAIYDVAVIGGGINGCGSAADAALRGLSVVLCEKGDIASGTSSTSTKLIHGGLRYLELYKFSLVKKALDERELLLQIVPHLVHPQSFIIPFQKALRSNHLLKFGLWLYDHLSWKNGLPRTLKITRINSQYFLPLKGIFTHGFIYYDAITDDARITLVNALQAKQHGAKILTHTALINAEVKHGIWHLTLQFKNETPYVIYAKSVINAAGPWVNTVAECLNAPLLHSITWSKGSHLVISALYDGNQAYLLQHSDNRIVFVIPYHGYSMIGTTDVAFTGSLENVQIEKNEIDYLIALVSAFFKKTIRRQDIIQTWSGVRPLLSDPGKDLKELSRDYKFEYTQFPAPLLTIYGGKITTYRKLAKQVVDSLCKVLGNNKQSITHIMPLPGAITKSGMPFKEYQLIAAGTYSWLPINLLERYLFTYGTNIEVLLNNCHSMKDLGLSFGNDLYLIEVEYLMREEWATTADDILLRRTKLGLGMNESEQAKLVEYIQLILNKSNGQSV